MDDEEQELEEVGMALPEREETLFTNKKYKAKMTDSIANLYKSEQEKSPDSYVFVYSKDNHYIVGEKAESLAKEYGLELKKGTINDKESKWVSFNNDEFDTVARELADKNSTVKIIVQNKNREDNFIETEDLMETIEVEVLPDYARTQEEMNRKGYMWNGMLPLTKERAYTLYSLGLTIFELDSNNNEHEISKAEEFNKEDYMFGIEKDGWDTFIHHRETYPFIVARKIMCDSVIKTLSNDMNTFDAMYTDPFIDFTHSEKEAVDIFLEKNSIYYQTEDVCPYLYMLLQETKEQIEQFPLSYYGWTISDVEKCLVDNVEDEEYKEYLKGCLEKGYKNEVDKVIEEMDLMETEEMLNSENINYKEEVIKSVEEENEEFTGGLEGIGIQELVGMSYTIHTRQVITDIIASGVLPDEVYKKLYEDKGKIVEICANKYIDADIESEQIDDGYREAIFLTAGYFDEQPLYALNEDNNSEEITEEKQEDFDNYYNELDLSEEAKAVIKKVNKEFEEYKTYMFAKSKNDILYNSYETYIKSELKETIAEGEYLNDTDYKTLNLQEANLLTSLFNDYMNSDGYSVDTYYETGNFIKDYCRDFRELSGIKVEGVEDDNMEEKQAQVNDSTSIAKEKVINRVKHEEELYREKIINGKTYEEFKDSEETRIKNLIIEAIENGVANDEDYEILNSIKGSITDRIFDEYCNDMDANISDPVNCSVFIDNFCKSYNDVFKDRSEAEIEKLVYEKIYLKEFYEDFDRTGQEPASFNEFIDNEWREEEIRNRGYKALENYLRIKEQTVLIGVSETDTLYLYFKDSLNMKNFLQAKDEEGFHEDYVIASPVSYLLPEDYEEQNIQFVKIGRDITEEELNSENAIFYMEKAEAHLNPITATYYNNLCAIDIEEAIKDNYDGMHLKEGFENKIIELYGLERVKLVLASNVLENIDDGRFRNETKEWARSIRMMNSEYDRRQYRIRTHPEVLNGFIQRIIKKQKQEENTSENTNRFELDNGFGEKITIEPTVELYNVKEPITETEKSGLAIQLWQVTKDDNGQEIKEPYALITKNFGEFIGVKNTAYIDINNCPFATQLLEKGIAEDTGATYRSGYVVYPLWGFKEEYLKKIGGENYEKYSQEFDDFIGNFNTKNNMEEEKEMPEKDEINEEKKVWLTAKVPDDVIIQTREKHTFMKMPETSEYAGYTFNLSNRMISSTTRLVDLESDSREQCLALVFGKDSIYTIRNRDEDEIELTGQAMYDLLENKKSSDFETKQDKSDWLNIIVPQEAMQGMYDNASLFFMPTNSDKKGYSYYIPNSLVKEDTSNDDGNFIISLPKEFEVHIKNKKTNDEMTISPNDLFDYCNNTKSKDYERIKQDKSEISQKSEETNEKDNGWVHASIPKEDCIAEYEKSRIYKMPNGKYEGYFYFLPNSFSKENVEKGTYTIGMPDDIKITLKDKEHNRELVISAKEYVDALKVKREEKQEENVVGEVKKDDKKRFNFNNRKGKFTEAIAKNLREKVPEEMQQRNNWIAVCTIEDKEKGKTLKYLINAKDCTYAESDNPDTWTSFDEAIKFALKKGADAIAYALDGKDNIACIDLDHCKNENEELTPLAKEVIGKSGNTYSEFSVSGKGMHFFGKTQGMDVRTFSKDGDMEFYQKEHFITMTGDSATTNKLESFDREEMKSLIEKKCEKRTIWKGQKQGVEGLSIMSDREIVERAMEGSGGETFKQLFLGVDIFNDHSRSDMSLMSRLTYYCNGDPEQTMRIFATSGLYRADKSPEYYECTLIKCIKGNTGRFQQNTYNAQPPKTKSGFNTK